MSNFAKGRQNRGKWLIVLIFILSCAAILPLSWSAIQAQRAQQRTMKALKKSLSDIEIALKTANCHAELLAPANALLTQALGVDRVFPRLSQAPGDFAKLSRALVRSSTQFELQVKSRDCAELRSRFPALKQRCDACHEQFDPQRVKKLSRADMTEQLRRS